MCNNFEFPALRELNRPHSITNVPMPLDKDYAYGYLRVPALRLLHRGLYTVCPKKNYNRTFRINNFQSIK